MGTGERGGGEHSGKCFDYGDDKMMNYGLREMNMNLDVYDSEGWLVINREASTRARNHQRVSPNPAHREWWQPEMLGRGCGHDQVSWSNFHNPSAGFVGRPPNFVNIDHNGRVMAKLVDMRDGYNGMRLMNGGCDSPTVVVTDSSDDDGEEEDIDYPGRKSKHVIKNKAPTKRVPQSSWGPWGHPGVVPKPCMKRNSENSGKNISEGNCYVDWETEDDDDCSDEDVGLEDDITLKKRSDQSGPRIHGQVGADPRLKHIWNLAHGVRPQTEGASYVNKEKAYHNPLNISGNKSTVSYGTAEDLFLMNGLRQKYLPNPDIGEGKLSGGSNLNSGAASYKTSVKNGGQEVDILPETKPSDIYEKKIKEHENAYMCDVPIEHGVVYPGMYEASTTRAAPHPKLKHLAHGVHPSETEAARHVGKKEAYCTPSNIHGKKITLSHGAAGVGVKGLESFRQKCLQNPYAREWILPSGSNHVSGANSCKMSKKNDGQRGEILSDAESSDDYDDEDLHFDDDEFDELEPRLAAESFKETNAKLEKKIKKDCAIRLTSKLAEDEKEKKQHGMHQGEESGEATDVSAGEQLQMETKKVAEQLNVHISFFEDYKNRVKEVAKLVKSHITSKPEADNCASERKQLMKIHEEKLKMKKRHQEEEQESEKQFAAALKCFVEKQTTLDSDSDASYGL